MYLVKTQEGYDFGLYRKPFDVARSIGFSPSKAYQMLSQLKPRESISLVSKDGFVYTVIKE